MLNFKCRILLSLLSLFFARNKTFMAQFEANKSKSIILYFFFASPYLPPFSAKLPSLAANILDRERKREFIFPWPHSSAFHQV